MRKHGSRTLLLALAALSLILRPSPAAPQEADPAAPAKTQAPASTEPAPEKPDGGGAPEPGAAVKPEPGAAAPTSPSASPAASPSASTADSICLLVESAAQAHGLPFEFFARLIWQESRFKPNAIGPMTRNGQRAEGIAQFMPGTARERGAFDPFDPVAALPKSAEFLEELHMQFGNLGLAAAAYNAGPQRVRDWLAGRSGLPAETRDYVLVITGHNADEWAAATRGQSASAAPLEPAKHTSCGELMAMLKEQPSVFVGALERRVSEGAARPWGVELAAGFQRDRVLAAYAAFEKSYRGILINRDPIIIGGRFRSRGTQTFYQARVGADTRADANQLCAQLRKAGGACLVLRNATGTAAPL